MSMTITCSPSGLLFVLTVISLARVPVTLSSPQISFSTSSLRYSMGENFQSSGRPSFVT